MGQQYRDMGFLSTDYHRKTGRVEAHLLVCFLSLALWRSLEMWMQGKRLGNNARKLINAFETVKSMDVSTEIVLFRQLAEELFGTRPRGGCRKVALLADLLAIGLRKHALVPSRRSCFDDEIAGDCRNAHAVRAERGQGECLLLRDEGTRSRPSSWASRFIQITGSRRWAARSRGAFLKSGRRTAV